MQKNFTRALGTDIWIEVPLLRDGARQTFGSGAKVWFTIDGILTVSTETDPARITIPDELDNKAIIFIPRTLTASKEAGTYRAECIVHLDAEDEQQVWRGEFTLTERLPAVT